MTRAGFTSLSAPGSEHAQHAHSGKLAGQREVVETIDAMIPPMSEAPGPIWGDIRSLVFILRKRLFGEEPPAGYPVSMAGPDDEQDRPGGEE